MKQRERYIVQERPGRKDYENGRKSMQLSLNFSSIGTWEM